MALVTAPMVMFPWAVKFAGVVVVPFIVIWPPEPSGYPWWNSVVIVSIVNGLGVVFVIVSVGDMVRLALLLVFVIWRFPVMMLCPVTVIGLHAVRFPVRFACPVIAWSGWGCCCWGVTTASMIGVGVVERSMRSVIASALIVISVVVFLLFFLSTFLSFFGFLIFLMVFFVFLNVLFAIFAFYFVVFCFFRYFYRFCLFVLFIVYFFFCFVCMVQYDALVVRCVFSGNFSFVFVVFGLQRGGLNISQISFR